MPRRSWPHGAASRARGPPPPGWPVSDHRRPPAPRHARCYTPSGLLDSRQPSSTEVPMRLIGLAVVLTFSFSLLLAPLAAEAQQVGKMWRIGWLGDGNRA